MENILEVEKIKRSKKINITTPQIEEHHKGFLILLPFMILMIMFLISPFISTFIGSFINEYGEFTLENYEYIFQSRFIKQSIFNSLELAFISTFVGLLISLQGAYSLNRLKNSSKKSILLFINMLSNFSGIPLAFAFIILLGSNGVMTILLKNIGLIDGFDVYSKTGLILMYIYFQLPLGLLLLYPVFDRLNPQWQEMVNIMGGSTFTFWKRVGIPVMLKEILGTMLIMFANAMGAYACTLALTNGTYNVMTIRITSYIAGEVAYEPGIASAMSILLGGILIFVVIINEVMLKKKRGKYEK
ncbi:ABC transporter permease [Candidatus Cetobacterium colombiensis]|uniref:ABC transporter permease n=1 Tax=Candidatus Cetobacterium colombiensis TaxID=3073100 RepID=A0ABU4WDP3_9FUSO|nr:ABC transporter permease [Candidatus Cetobacterium colombiensis]MDX8336623.1 ABC transporter permease [Candidatus Cetobacterium colombiensis]